MLTAHLPSGYCLAKSARLTGLAFAAAIVGAVLPDIDMLFFYFIDNRSIHHHRYWVHIPAFWIIVACIVLPVLWRSTFRMVSLAFFAGILLHLILDSIGGGIMWLAPFNTTLWELVTVPASQSHWILSFMMHWTFAFEAMIWAGTIYFYLKDRQPAHAGR